MEPFDRIKFFRGPTKTTIHFIVRAWGNNFQYCETGCGRKIDLSRDYMPTNEFVTCQKCLKSPKASYASPYGIINRITAQKLKVEEKITELATKNTMQKNEVEWLQHKLDNLKTHLDARTKQVHFLLTNLMDEAQHNNSVKSQIQTPNDICNDPYFR